jgi:sugar O-acyltransferase (sialic acid O-acetyltransferase NeuD family)
MNILVLAAGGHSGVVIDALRSRNVDPAGIVDQEPSLWGQMVHGVRVIGSDSQLESMKPETVQLANGLGNRAARSESGLDRRRALFEHFSHKRFHFPSIVHAQAIVSPRAVIGDGVQIMAGSLVQPGAVIGVNTILNSRSLIEHDCLVGAHAHIAPGAILCGDVKVGDESHVGAGAIVLQGRSIGLRAVIAAGAVVTRDVGDGETYGRPLSDAQ